MTTSHTLIGYWHINIFAIFLAVLLIVFHFESNGMRFSLRSNLFLSGIILLLLVSVSPLTILGHYYLFSAHMIIHIVLLLIIPPLLLTGTDPNFLERQVRKPFIRILLFALANPFIAWLLGIGIMWIIHIPRLFNLMMVSPVFINIQMLVLLVCGIIFAWPVFAPIPEQKLTPLKSVLYLFTACVGCTILGVIITFSPPNLYHMTMGKDPDIIDLIRSEWQITQDLDQQIGGLIMWVPACLIYLIYIMIILMKWYQGPESEEYVKY